MSHSKRSRTRPIPQTATAPRLRLAVEPLIQAAKAALQGGRVKEAQAICRHAVVLEPADLEALFSCAHTHMVAREYGAAYPLVRRAWHLAPGNFRIAITYAKLALHFRHLGLLKPILTGIRPPPGDPEYPLLSGHMLLAQSDFVGAIAAFTRRLEIVPDCANAHLYRGVAHQAAGFLREAIDDHQRAVELDPANPVATSNLIVMRDFDLDATMADLAAVRRDWNRRHGTPPEPPAPHLNDRDPERPLRIGYVSSYFHNSSGAEILVGIVENRDRAQHDAVCYSSGMVIDEMTRRFRTQCRWVDARGLDDAALADRIRLDRIDILVDLDGHSPRNRLTLFSRKPAPVQVTGWGHAGGTGLAAMDYAFVDPVFVRPDEQVHFAEKLVNLPCVLTMQPPLDAPPVAACPVDRHGVVTFGCFNRLTKVSPVVLGLWARILHAVAGSRLLLKGRLMEDPGVRGSIERTMREHGIGPERLVLVGGTPRAEHLAAHAEADIALDPFPLTGGISTVEALWMGLPVVTFAGPTMYGRVSAAVLAALHEPELVARSLDDYVARAVALAGDRQMLRLYRATLRERVAGSPVANVTLYTRAVEAAYRAMWRTWCSS